MSESVYRHECAMHTACAITLGLLDAYTLKHYSILLRARIEFNEHEFHHPVPKGSRSRTFLNSVMPSNNDYSLFALPVSIDLIMI